MSVGIVSNFNLTTRSTAYLSETVTVSSGFTIGGNLAVTDWISTKVVSGSIVDGGFTYAPRDGAFAISDAGRFAFRNSSSWHYVAPLISPYGISKVQESVVTIFASGHGYVKQTSQGTQSNDSTVVCLGSQSLKLVSDGANSVVQTRVSGLSPGVDTSGKYLKTYVQVDDTSKVNQLWVYASSDNFGSSFYAWKIEDDITFLKNNTWTPVTFTFGEATVTQAPNRSSIISLQLRVRDDGTGVVTSYWNGITTFTEPSAGAVSIIFDDGWLSQYEQARPKLDTYGYAATAYVIPSKVDASNYMTTAQLRNLQDINGWLIASHGLTDLTTLTAAQTEAEVLTAKEWMVDNGFKEGSDHYAYPNGGYDETTVIPIVKKYFKSARTIVSYQETIPPANPYKLRVFLVLNTSTTASIQSAVASTINNKDWCILVFHKIVPTASVSTEYSVANFNTVIDNINTQGAVVKTVADVLRT